MDMRQYTKCRQWSICKIGLYAGDAFTIWPQRCLKSDPPINNADGWAVWKLHIVNPADGKRFNSNNAGVCWGHHLEIMYFVDNLALDERKTEDAAFAYWTRLEMPRHD